MALHRVRPRLHEFTLIAQYFPKITKAKRDNWLYNSSNTSIHWPNTKTILPEKSTVCYPQSFSCTRCGSINHAGIEIGGDLVDLLPRSKLLLPWQRPYKGETGSLFRLLNGEAGFVDTGWVARFANVIERTSINCSVLRCGIQVVVNKLTPL